MRNFQPILFSLVFSFFIAYPSVAQPPGGRPGGGGQPEASTIEGRVVDEADKPVPYATIALYKAGDSSLVDGITTNDAGRFSLSAQPGMYFITVSFLSFDDQTITGVEVKPRQATMLSKIVLRQGGINLDELVIEGEKAQMEIQLDKRVFNVGKDMANIGRNATDILDNLPSITVDVDGNVALRGSENVQILIDGRPSTLAGNSGTALRQLQGNMIDRIEVITNPSARYDAEGEVGIINIVLKKDRRQGVNGSIDLNAGYPENFGAAVNLNYRREAINLFGSYALNYRNSPGSGFASQAFTLADTTFYFDRIQSRTRGGISHNMRFGSDIFLNSRNTLTGSVLYKTGFGLNTSDMLYLDQDEFGNVFREVSRLDSETERDHDLEFNLAWKKTFAQKGRTLTADVKRVFSTDQENSDIHEFSFAPIEFDMFQRTSNMEQEGNWFFQTDYIHPFRKDGKLELGIKSGLRRIENDFIVEQLGQNGEDWHILPDFENHFVYTENIHAAYLMAGDKFGKFSVQGGLRAEYSDITTEMRGTEYVYPREYLDFFPSVHTSYEAGKGHTIQLSYSRRISRPRFRHLLPFYNFSDNRSLFTGNPDLNPEYSNSFELGHLKYHEKYTILSSVYYRYKTDVIQRITNVDTAGRSRVFPVNIAEEHNIGIEFSGSVNPVRWLSINGSFNFYRSILEGTYEDLELSADMWTWNARTSAKATIRKKYETQATFFYRAPQAHPQGRMLSMYGLDLAVGTDVLKGKGTLTASVSDAFNTRRFRWDTSTPEFTSVGDFQWRARQFMVNFNYRINQNKRQARRGGPNGGMDDGDFMGM